MAILSLRGDICLIKSFLVFILCGTCVLSQSSVNPGVRTRMTDKALDSVGRGFVNQLFTDGKQVQLPDQNGSKKFIILGAVDYKIFNVQVKNVVKPVFKTEIKPNRMNWILNNASLSIGGNWSYSYKLIYNNISDSGNVAINVTGVSVNVSIAVGFNASVGRPVLSATGCNCNISNVTIKLNGGASWFYIFFTGQIQKELGSQIQSKVCDLAKALVTVKANAMIALFPWQRDIGSDLMMDARYLSAPVFKDGYVESMHNGTVYDKKNPTKPPMQAAPIPETGDSSRSPVDICISEYVFNTKANAVFKRGALSQHFSNSDLPPSMKGLFNTTCYRDSVCFGSFFSQISSKYPNSAVEVEMVATSSPVASISPDGVQVDFTHNVTARVRLPDGSLSTSPLFTAKVNMTALVSPTLDPNQKLKASVTSLTPAITLTSSTISEITPNKLSAVFDPMAKQFLIPKMNAMGEEGFQLPVHDCIRLKDAALTTFTNCLRITADVDGSP